MKDERLPYLDGWRGLAILMVLISHFGPPIQVARLDFGRFGVDLFFVLSGLLMSRILFEQRMSIGKFYRRRISRIIPVFLVFVAVCWIGWGKHSSWKELLATLTFTRTYFTHPDIYHTLPPDGNLWSLNVEEQCYMLLALIAALRLRPSAILFGLAALTVVAAKLHVHYGATYPYLLATECASGGLLLAAAYRPFAKWTAPQWAPPLALLGALGCYYYRETPWYPWYLYITISPVLLAFSVNHIQQSWTWIVRALEWRPLCQLGVLSYSIYLWQEPFHMHPGPFRYGTSLIAAILIGCASYYLLERPARRWLNAHWGAKREVVPLPVAT